MWRTLSVSLILVFCATYGQAQTPPPRNAPVCKVDPSWPTVPDNWIFGAMAGIATDSKDNVWVIHRAAGVTMKKACCRSAPVVMQFAPSGQLLQSWEGRTDGNEWPLPNNEHGIFVDHKDNVWIAGRGAQGTSENQILKFDTSGKLLLQIGRRGTGNDSNDTANLGQPADMAVHAATNEVFVADGYGNRRIVVFDADTGKYKRHWGAYGNKPDDAAPRTISNQGPGDQQFNQVHHVRVSRDGLVYVADRLNRRIQVFTIEGKFVKEAFVRRNSPEAAGTVSSLAFSAGSDQQYLYVSNQADDVIVVLDRQSLVEVASCGRLGRQAGQFVSPHNIATDSKGNLYVAEDLGGARLQKFVFETSSR